jgi:hypothetical protein
MANWKKVIVSSSNAELANLTSTGTEVKLTGITSSAHTTPVVIDADGRLSTGSAYALKSGGDTVGGSGLSSSVAIVGAQTQTTIDNGDGTFTTTFADTSLIQTASATIPLDLNQADIINADDITAKGSGSFSSVSSSGGYTIHTSSFASISNQTLTVGNNTLTTHITASNIILEASGGITASVVPEIVKPTFYLGIGADGEVQKIAESNVQGGGTSGVSGITTCSSNENINLNVSTTSGTEAEEHVGSNFYISNDGSTVFHNIADSNISDYLANGTTVRLKGKDVALQSQIEVDFTVDEIVEAGGTAFEFNFPTNGSFTITSPYAPASDGNLIRAELYVVTTGVGTGVVEICLDENLSLNDITQSGDLIFSASTDHGGSEVPTQHFITAASGSELYITASGISSSNIDVENLFIGGFSFASATATVTSASTIFGEDLTDTHRFTGSIEFGGDLTYVGSGSSTGETTLYAPFFSGSGANLGDIAMSNTDIKKLSGTNGILISSDGSTEVGYNGQTIVDARINLSGSSLEVVSNGLGIKDNGVTTTKIKDDAVTTAKLATVNGTVGTFGSATAIPAITVNAEGQVTGITTNAVSTGFSIAGDSGTDTVAGGETLTFTGGNGITTAIIDNTVTISQDKDSLSLTGTTTIASLQVTNGISVTNTDGGNNSFAGTTSFAGNVTIGNEGTDSHTINGASNFKNNVDIDGTLNVDGNTTLDDVTIDGTLTVTGTTTTLNTTNLHVEDRFIRLNTSTDTTEIEGVDVQNNSNKDSGIIFDSGSIDNHGMALYYDNSSDRLAVGKDVDDAGIGNGDIGGGGANGVVAGQIVTVRTLSSTVGTALTTTKGILATEVAFGSGEMVIDSANDIWIYTNA